MNEYINLIDDMTTTEEELIEAHKNLVDKIYYNEEGEPRYSGLEFILELITRDYNSRKLYNYSIGAQKFIKSDYLSDCFKTGLMYFYKLSNFENEDFVNIINSKKAFKDMNASELQVIYSVINRQSKFELVDDIVKYFKIYLYKLSTKEIIEFIKNNNLNSDFALYILNTSGLIGSKLDYYECGVDSSILNEQNLLSIFNKFLKIDNNCAIEFVRIIKQTKHLTALEVMKKVEKFVKNNFKSFNEEQEENRYISVQTKKHIDSKEAFQINASESLKRLFISEIRQAIDYIDPNFDYEYVGLYQRQKKR